LAFSLRISRRGTDALVPVLGSKSKINENSARPSNLTLS
jgi:hypothetical protein